MHLIGKTGHIQKALRLKCTRLREAFLRGEPVSVLERRLLFTGPPGVGKTELGTELALHLAGGHPFSVEKSNGANVTIEVVRDWTRSACYRPMTGDIAVKFVDEIDAVGNTALNDLRTYLDELSPHRVFIACTNSPVNQLQEQLQSRFQVISFAPIPAEEIAALLCAKYQLPAELAKQIAFKARGNVRAAESDALTQLDAFAAAA